MTSFLLVCAALLADAPSAFVAWTSEPAQVTVLPASVAQRLTAAEISSLATGKPVMPFDDLTIAERTKDGGIWAASHQGLMYLAPGAPRWRLFHSRRWLPNDDVQDLAVTATGDVYVKTPAGMGKLAARSTTVEAKMIAIDDALVKYHVRDGFVTASRLKEAGKLESAEVHESNDNDGLWTSIYVAAEAFRFAVTGDPVAKKNARRSLEAMMFLERISGIPGFAARSVIPIDRDPKRHRGEWHRSADNRWWWKGDTSSDEVDGHYFAYAIYYDVAADEKEKAEIREYVARITDHILDHDLYYVGPPGKPTTWGVWSPKSLNHDLRRIGDRGLNSLEILSHLKVAEHIVGKPRYAEMAKELIEKHSYHANLVEQRRVWPAFGVNHSDDELAFLAYYPLLQYERDPLRREYYLTSVKRTWLIERPERSPLFNLIYGASLQASEWTHPEQRPPRAMVEPAEYDRDECVEWFRDIPADTIGWTINNSHRRDIKIAGENRFRRQRGTEVLPPSERHVMRWNGDPYVLDGGHDGRDRDDGAAILLPYWMGRYHRLID